MKRGKGAGKGKRNGKGRCGTPLSANIVLIVLLTLHEIEHRHELDPSDPREAEGEEDEVQIFLQFDHRAGVVGVDGDVWFVVHVRRQWRVLGGEGRRDTVGEGGRGGVLRTREVDLDLSRQDFVNGVDLLEGVDAVGGGFDVDDGVHEGGVLGEAGGWGQDGNTGSKERERERERKERRIHAGFSFGGFLLLRCLAIG